MIIRDFDITYGEALAPAVRFFWGAGEGQGELGGEHLGYSRKEARA